VQPCASDLAAKTSRAGKVGRIVVMPYALDSNDMKMWTAPAFTPADWLQYAVDTFDWLHRESGGGLPHDVPGHPPAHHRPAGSDRLPRALHPPPTFSKTDLMRSVAEHPPFGDYHGVDLKDAGRPGSRRGRSRSA